MSTRLSLILVLALAACGSKSKSTVENGTKTDEPTCCCAYVAEFGSEEEGNWREEQTHEFLSMGSCTAAAGSCVDDAALCSAK